MTIPSLPLETKIMTIFTLSLDNLSATHIKNEQENYKSDDKAGPRSRIAQEEA
jgi:hypothetical protein